MATTIPNIVSAAEAAELLQIDKSLVCRYCRSGKIKAERFGVLKQWFIKKSELKKFKPNPRGNPTFVTKAS